MELTPDMIEQVLTVLYRVQLMNKDALPMFDWSTSCLDAHSISLLNEVPTEVDELVFELENF